MTGDGHVRLREHLGVKFPRVTRQYFCGFEFFQHKMPIDPSLMTRWRKRVGPDTLEEVLKATVAVALETIGCSTSTKDGADINHRACRLISGRWS